MFYVIPDMTSACKYQFKFRYDAHNCLEDNEMQSFAFGNGARGSCHGFCWVCEMFTGDFDKRGRWEMLNEAFRRFLGSFLSFLFFNFFKQKILLKFLSFNF
jgi:hypothetical protein